MKIDGEITDKIRALFDDREVIHKKLDNIQVDINIYQRRLIIMTIE
jgi:hypothetical protein